MGQSYGGGERSSEGVSEGGELLASVTFREETGSRTQIDIVLCMGRLSPHKGASHVQVDFLDCLHPRIG